MNKIPLVLFGSAVAMFGQPLSFGVKGGLPLTDFIDTVSGNRATVSSVTNRYIIGPTLEVHLPFGLGVEVDALYRHFSFNTSANLVDALLTTRTTASAWEFPVLLKKRFGHGPIRPFVNAGANFNKISGLSQTVQTLVFPSRLTTTTNSHPPEFKNDFTAGFTVGAGVDFHPVLVHIMPEIRYTRWGTQHFNGIIPPGGANGLGGSLTSNQNQAEFLVGITF